MEGIDQPKLRRGRPRYIVELKVAKLERNRTDSSSPFAQARPTRPDNHLQASELHHRAEEARTMAQGLKDQNTRRVMQEIHNELTSAVS